MGHAIGTICQLAFNVVIRHKIGDFPGNRNRQISSGVALKGLDAGDPAVGRIPERLLANTIGCYNPQSRNDHTSMSHSRFPYR